MKTLLAIVAGVAIIYLAGLLLVLAKVSSGYEGGDLMTEHYRGVLQTIIN